MPRWNLIKTNRFGRPTRPLHVAERDFTALDQHKDSASRSPAKVHMCLGMEKVEIASIVHKYIRNQVCWLIFDRDFITDRLVRSVLINRQACNRTRLQRPEPLRYHSHANDVFSQFGRWKRTIADNCHNLREHVR